MSKITAQEASKIAQKHFKITAEAIELDGYEDENFLLETNTEDKYLLKISSEENNALLNFQNEILSHLSTKNLPFQTSKVLNSEDGNSLVTLSNDKTARLLSWVPGRM